MVSAQGRLTTANMGGQKGKVLGEGIFARLASRFFADGASFRASYSPARRRVVVMISSNDASQ